MDWIHPWIGLDWIGSGFSGNFVDCIRWHDCDPMFIWPITSILAEHIKYALCLNRYHAAA